MKFSIAGSGNVAWHFAEMLTKGGHLLLQVYARNKDAAYELANEHGASVIEGPQTFSAENDFVLLAVSDNSIAEVSVLMPQNIFTVHTSGAGDINLLSQERRGVIWPVQSLVKGKETNYARIPFLIEASDKESEAMLQIMMKNIAGNVVLADSSKRLQAHTAAVFANNFTNALYTIAEEILHRNHLPDDLLVPLIEGHIEKLHQFPAAELQTGPARRNDQKTIDQHLKQLAANPEQAELYRMLSDYITQKFYGKKL